MIWLLVKVLKHDKNPSERGQETPFRRIYELLFENIIKNFYTLRSPGYRIDYYINWVSLTREKPQNFYEVTCTV